MNDRDAIARELRSLPSSMRHLSAGCWEIELVDEPSNSVGGAFPAAFPAMTTSEGNWVLTDADESGTGAVIVLASTQLCGMPAAHHAAALRAAVLVLRPAISWTRLRRWLEQCCRLRLLPGHRDPSLEQQ